MTRVNVIKRTRIPLAGGAPAETWILIDSDTGQEITHGSKEEIHLRAARVTEIHDRHAAMSQELECNCDVPNQVQCDLHGPRE